MTDNLTAYLAGLADWITQGFEAGYCSPVTCTTHDQLPCTAEETDEFETGFDPCIYGVRIYEDERPS
jgi:hypothetical protein